MSSTSRDKKGEGEFLKIRRTILGSDSGKRYKIVDKNGACVGCTGTSPFVMTSEYDILTKNDTEHIFEGSKIMCSALHSEDAAGKRDIISYRIDAKKGDLILKASSLIKSFKHGEAENEYFEEDYDFDANEDGDSKGEEKRMISREGGKILKTISENFHEKVKVLGHYACAVRSLHSMGYFHLNIEPQNLLIHKSSSEASASVKGVLHNFENATAFSKTKDRHILTKTSRGHPIFRPPEHYLLHHIETSPGKRSLHFKIDEKFDVWSLGMCFLHFLTELPVFVIHPGRPHLSAKGAERIEALEAKSRGEVTKKQIVNAIITECVRWQTLRLFGSTGTKESPLSEIDKNESDLKRKISISAMIMGAVRRGLIPNDDFHPAACEDLLFKMLNPSPEERITIQEVCVHPLFKDYLIAPATRPSLSSSVSVAIDEWTPEKDKAVKERVKYFLKSSEASHLSGESIFVLFDMLVRVANGMEKDKAKTRALQDSLAATTKVCFSLYDVPLNTFPYESDITRTLEPVVIEYLKGDLRRPGYLYDHLYTQDQAKTLLNLMTGDDENAILFRENYGRLDMKKFLGELFGKGYQISLYSPSSPNHSNLDVKVYHLLPHDI